MTLVKRRRERSVVLTLQGWQKLEQARSELVIESQALNTFKALDLLQKSNRDTVKDLVISIY